MSLSGGLILDLNVEKWRSSKELIKKNEEVACDRFLGDLHECLNVVCIMR